MIGEKGAGRRVQRPVRAVLYGVSIWLVWVTIWVIAFEVLPEAIAGSALFVSVKWVLLVVLVVGIAASYLDHVAESSRGEGIVIGALWAATFVVLDVLHFTAMHPASLEGYFMATVPPYLGVPAVTTLLLGWLRGRSATTTDHLPVVG